MLAKARPPRPAPVVEPSLFESDMLPPKNSVQPERSLQDAKAA
jgi:hypothetical protein